MQQKVNGQIYVPLAAQNLPEEQSAYSCCVTISWTTDAKIFTDYARVPSVIPAFNGIVEHKYGTSCPFNCNDNDFHVYLNQTDDFVHADPLTDDPCDYNNHFFITTQNTKSGWYSLQAILEYEMGWFLGFYDTWYGFQSGDCYHNGSIMNFENHMSDYEEPAKADLDADDVCMYKKMYCWSTFTDVDDNTTGDFKYKIFPNPANNDKINLLINNPTENPINFTIISSIGQPLMSGQIQAFENEKTFNLDNFASGIYVLILNYGGKQEVRKFAINK